MKFSSQQKKEIVKAIGRAEQETSGEIRVHLSYTNTVEELLPLAKKQFEKMKMHETRERNAVLLYINPKIKKFALYGDQGIHEKVGQIYWESLKETLQKKIRETDLLVGICHAVEELGNQLKTYYPHTDSTQNELDNEVSESD